MTIVALAALMVILVGPGPVWVRSWRFLYRVPRAAVVLWQAGSVAALIALVGAGVLAAHGAATMPPGADGPLLGAVVVMIFTLIVVVRLAWALVKVARTTGLRRRRHWVAVDLLGRLDPLRPLPGLRMVAEQLPLAYCLPAWRDSRVVLSVGALGALGSKELAAVLAHESAHVRARHDLVLDTFTALHRAFPMIVRSEIPWQECTLLVEMLADDAALRRAGALPLARALVTMAESAVPSARLGMAGDATAIRVTRLADAPRANRLLAACVYALSAGLVVLPIALMVLV